MAMRDPGRCTEEAHDLSPLGSVGAGSPAVEQNGDRVMGHFVGDCREEAFMEMPREQIGVEPHQVMVGAASSPAAVLSGRGAREIEADIRQAQVSARVARDDLKAAANLPDDTCPGCGCQPCALHVVSLVSRNPAHLNDGNRLPRQLGWASVGVPGFGEGVRQRGVVDSVSLVSNDHEGGGTMWDERYAGDEYAYGTEPNDFLRAVAPRLPVGKTLCLGEGEGRNAAFLAGLGHEVTALDASAVGLEKTRRLAETKGVTVRTLHADLADYSIAPDAWDVIVSIFCHLPPGLRRRVHEQVAAGLHRGGTFVLEAYTVRQLELATGGPASAEMMMDIAGLREELAGLRLDHAAELQREIQEGRFHSGKGAVVQVLAIKG
jgi:SAM-dependent methyltransferase